MIIIVMAHVIIQHTYGVLRHGVSVSMISTRRSEMQKSSGSK